MNAESNLRTVLVIEGYKKVLRNLRLPQLRKAMEFAGESKYGNKPRLIQKGDILLYLGFPGFGRKILELEAELRNGTVGNRNGVLPEQPGSVQRLPQQPQVFPNKVPLAGSHSNSNLFPGSGSLLNLSSQSPANDSGASSVGVPVSPSGSNYNFASVPVPALAPPDSPLVKKTPKKRRITIGPRPTPNGGTMTPTLTPVSTPTPSLTITPPKTPVVSGSEDDDVERVEVPEYSGQRLAKLLETLEEWAMWRMPFHDVVQVLLPPTELRNGEEEERSKLKVELEVPELEPGPGESSNSNGAHLTNREVFVRFCVHDGISMGLEPEDFFPPKLSLEVNQNPIPFNQTRLEHDLKKYSHPVNVTKHINPGRKDNTVEVGWIRPSDSNSSSLPRYYVSAYLCKSLTVEELSMRVAQHPPLPISLALSKIHKILEAGDSEVKSASSTVKVNLLCPFSMQRIRMPCIGIKCTHLTSFDLYSFLHISLLAKHTRLRCPICRTPLKVEEMRIDQFYVNLLLKLPPHLKEVQVDSNGKVRSVDKAEAKLKPVKKIPTQINPIPPVPIQSVKNGQEKEMKMVEICLD